MKLGENMPKFGSCPQGVHFCGLMDRVDTEWTPLFSRFCRCVHCVFPLILRSDFSISISAFRFQRSSNPLTSFSVPAARALRASSAVCFAASPRIDCRYVCDVIKAVPELGYIERVPMENNILLLADEEGHIKGLPHNFFLSFPNSKHFPVQDIIGTVVFIKTKPLPPLDEEIYDYEVDGLSNEDVELIKKIFTEDNQAKLSKKFDEIYKDRDYWSPIVTTW